MQGSTRAHTQVHSALSMHTAYTFIARHPDAVTAPLRARGQDPGHWGGGPTSSVTGWATPPGSSPGLGGESVGGAPRDLCLGEGEN